MGLESAADFPTLKDMDKTLFTEYLTEDGYQLLAEDVAKLDALGANFVFQEDWYMNQEKRFLGSGVKSHETEEIAYVVGCSICQKTGIQRHDWREYEAPPD